MQIADVQFLHTVLHDLKRYEAVTDGARAITAIKGVEVNGTDIETFANLINSRLNIPTSALSGANIALEGELAFPLRARRVSGTIIRT